MGVGRCALDEQLEIQRQIFIGDNGDFGLVLRALLGEFVDLAVPCQGINLKTVGMPCDHIERGYADAAGAAQDGERLHDGVPLEWMEMFNDGIFAGCIRCLHGSLHFAVWGAGCFLGFAFVFA